MEAVDNPSYFSLPGESTSGSITASSRSPFSLLKRRGTTMGANTSSASVTSSTCTSSSLIHHGSGTRNSNSAPSTPTTPEASITLPPPAPTQPTQHRRSFRSLLRSMSANTPTTPLQQQLLVLGQPRPSDLAPASPSMPHLHQHRRNNSNKTLKSPKSSTELLNSDMIYCPVSQTPSPLPAVSPEFPPESPTEEVLLGSSGDARYYNITAAMTIPLPGSSANGRRRHSIGTFLSKERAAAAAATKQSSTKNEAAVDNLTQKVSATNLGSSPREMTATAAIEHYRPSHSRKRCNRCCGGKGNRAADMDDILIVSSRQSQAAALWVSYLNTCFEQICKSRNKPPFKILCVGVEDVVGPSTISVALEEKLVRVRLQIVILCPQFLEHIYQNPGPGTTLGRLLQPDRVLAMLLGVDEGKVTEQHRAALISYKQWRRLPVKDQDESFVGDFLEVAMGILARACRQHTIRSERALFSLLPKKVNEGQNKVIVLLTEPMEKEDQIKIKIDKNGEILEVTSMKRRNPYTLHFQMPECCMEVSMLVSIHVEKNGQALGIRQVKCESRMRELDQILRSLDNPLEFVCQTLGISPGDREHLDNVLVAAFQRNIPPHFNLLQTPGPTHQHRPYASPEEYPTLLHFAARFGLEKLAWQLLECPGGENAFEIRNVCDMTPAEMAEAAGHSKLANALRGYMQMTEFTSMYSYLKIMSEGNAKPAGFNEAEYHRPRPLSETYQVPPSARTIMEQNYQIPPSARPFNLATTQAPTCESTEMGGYLEMHPSSANSKHNFKDNLDFLNTATLSNKCSETASSRASPSSKSTSQGQLDQIALDSGQDEKLLQTGAGLKKSHEHLNNGVQDELLEIINDFKNNVFTISEVEKLVENWKNRNDVQQSFKDKQEQLNQMREEYERLQQQMKEQMKRATPFDRIRNFFRGKSKDAKENSAENSSMNPAELNKTTQGDSLLPLCQRPVSSLSLHSISSSSSSGRMSTLSGCSGTSLGDSGTHSDNEDRKICSPHDFHKMNGVKGGIHNYEIPPAPRPIHSTRCLPVSTRLNLMHITNTIIEHRPPIPMPRFDYEDNYVTPDAAHTSVSEALSKSPIFQRKGESVWSETEERISQIISSQTPLQKKAENQNSTEAEYLTLENEHDENKKSGEVSISPNAGPDYINVSYPDSQDSGDGSKSSQNDMLDVPDYVNVTLPEKSAPPIPPRIPCRKKN